MKVSTRYDKRLSANTGRRCAVIGCFWIIISIAMATIATAAREPIETFRQILPETGTNFLVNGNFQKDSDADGMPDEWGSIEHWKEDPWKVEVKRVKLPEDKYALSVKFLTDGGCLINYLLREEKRYFSFQTPVTIFQSLRVWNKGSGMVWGYWGPPSYGAGGSTSVAGPGSGWQNIYSLSQYIPTQHEGIAMARIYIRNAKAGDEYLITDYVMAALLPDTPADKLVALEKEAGMPLAWRKIPGAEADKAKDVRKGNLLRDSSFESNPNICEARYGSKWWATIDAVKAAQDAVHGEYAAETFLGNIRSDPYEYRGGVPHTFSFYAKACSGTRVAVNIMAADKIEDRRKQPIALGVLAGFSVKPTWDRYSFSFVPGENPSTYVPGENPPGYRSLAITLHSSTNCQIDAVQLEEGGMTDYKPQELEMFVLMPRQADRSKVTFFYDDENPPVVLTATKNGPVKGKANFVECDSWMTKIWQCIKGPEKVRANLVVRDFWMKEIWRKAVTFKMPAEKVSGQITLNLPQFPRGMYRVHLESGKEKSRSMVYGVIGRNLAEGSSICGGSHSTGLDYNRAFIEALGVTWTRHHAAYWGPYGDARTSMPADGSFDWTAEDRDITQKRKAKNLRFWGSMIYPPAPWRDMGKPCVSEGKTNGPPLDEKFLSGMEEYMRAAVRHFDKNVKYWECWNEPMGYFTPEQYLQMLKRYYLVVKEGDPEAVVVGFSGFLFQDAWKNFMVPLMRLGALQYCDVVSYHGYFDEWPEEKLFGFQSLATSLDYIREEMSKTGQVKTIWDNELTLWGESWYDDERIPPAPRNRSPHIASATCGGYCSYREGAVRIVHYVTIGYAHGVRQFSPHCFDYDLVFQEQPRVEYDQRAFDYDYSLKPKAVSYAVVCNKMEKAKFVHEYTGTNILWYVFEKPDNATLAVVFARKGAKGTFVLSDRRGLTFLNIFDAPFTGIKSVEQGAEICLTGEPMYIETNKKPADLIGLLKAVEATWKPVEDK